MTSLGRLIFFDQPGTGASDPVTPGALPTLEQWADSITAVLDDLGSREAVLLASHAAFATAALFAATHPTRTTALVVFDGYADAGGTRLVQDEIQGSIAMWGSGELQHLVNPDMPWNEEIRAAWARLERLAASPKALALVRPLAAEMDVRAVLPTIRLPTLVVQHSDSVFVPPAKGKYIAEHIPDAKYLEVPGRNWHHIVEPWRQSFREVASSSLASRLMWPMIGFWLRCSSPTSWTRRAALRRWGIVTGTRCSMRMTPSFGRSCPAFEAAR